MSVKRNRLRRTLFIVGIIISLITLFSLNYDLIMFKYYHGYSFPQGAIKISTEGDYWKKFPLDRDVATFFLINDIGFIDEIQIVEEVKKVKVYEPGHNCLGDLGFYVPYIHDDLTRFEFEKSYKIQPYSGDLSFIEIWKHNDQYLVVFINDWH